MYRKSKSDCPTKIPLCKSGLSEVRTVCAADSISLSSYIDLLLCFLSLLKQEKWWDEWKGDPLWCATDHLEHPSVPLECNWRWTLQLAVLVIKMAKEWFGQWYFKKRAKTYTFKVVNSHSFMAQNMQQVKPMPDFLSVAGGCEAHLIPCSINPLEHVTRKFHHLGPFLQSSPVSDWFFYELWIQEKV